MRSCKGHLGSPRSTDSSPKGPRSTELPLEASCGTELPLKAFSWHQGGRKGFIRQLSRHQEGRKGSIGQPARQQPENPTVDLPAEEDSASEDTGSAERSPRLALPVPVEMVETQADETDEATEGQGHER